MNLSAHRRLSLVLWLAAVHSGLIGLGLIAIPPSLMALFGLQACDERFFPVQGGVFHLVMAAIYAWAAVKLLQARELIKLAVMAKCIAAVFLVTYYLVVQSLWVVLASAVVDALMAALIYWTFTTCERQPRGVPPASWPNPLSPPSGGRCEAKP